MTVKFGFYNSVDGDRRYDAVDISKIFDGVITDGVFESIGTSLKVTANTGMNVLVGEGKAWFNHTWTINDAALVMTVDPSELTLKRIDTVVLEINATSSIRANNFKIIKGTPASSPSPATLTNTIEIHQYPLAYITVNAGVTSILTADISNTVGTSVCPYITVPQAGGGGGAPGAAVLETQVFS